MRAIRCAMDIARPDLKQRRRKRQILWGSLGALLLAGITIFVLRLKPAAPTVDRNTIWTDTVKRGNMLRQVRGLGTLVPREDKIRSIPAETEGTVVRILQLPGATVHPDTVILQLTNPQLVQEAQDAMLQLREAEADYQNTQVSVNSSLMDQRTSMHSTNRRSCRQKPTRRFTGWASSAGWRTATRRAKPTPW
jgi:HlyD family secretion protein